QHAMLMQPGKLHANVDRTPPADFIVVQIGEELMKRVARELGWRHANLNIKHPSSSHPPLLEALQRIRTSLCTDLFRPGSGPGQCTCRRDLALQLENLDHLVGVFVDACAESSSQIVLPRRGAALIPKAVNYLRRNYRDPYDLDRVAAAVGCS